MIAKSHRQNHDFTILANIVGSCHTADAAHALLCDLREDRQSAVDSYDVQLLRDKAKIIRADRLLASDDESDQIEGKATLLELANNRRAGEVLLAAAHDEIAFIDKCIAEIQPKRKYAHLTDAESVEACQQEEWRLELISRAENSLLTMGTIPVDQFETMRQHPDFAAGILPRIVEIQGLLASPNGAQQLRSQIAQQQRLLEGSIK